ncbi:MAG: preprotein translocase subunit SecA, partial [Armatimonadetes bacterium]|nr:preprotein translocase subunit SecA [Armatimonadota bacterium]
MRGLLNRLLGDQSDREVGRLQPVVEEISALEPEYQQLTDDQLRERVAEWRAQVQEAIAGLEGEERKRVLHEELDALLPHVFAAVREASRRTIGQRHFDVQLIGGAVLHRGKIAEMKTGEGKT